MDRFGPEISDLVVDYDPSTRERRDVAKRSVLERLTDRRARRVVRAWPDGVLDRDHVDGILLRSHLELQRLHEEFRVGESMRAMLAPMIAHAREVTGQRMIRVVDLGCGLGYIVRWLAARGGLDDVELVGADYNRALVTAAQRLAEAERLSCKFVVGNAFELDVPAHVVMSTGVMHHFRGDDLAAVFAQHERAGVVGWVHADIRPSLVAPIGAWIFHQARMREPLARYDGYWSAVRAHDGDTLAAAMAAGAPSYARGLVDAKPGLIGLLRIFQAAVGARTGDLRAAYAGFGRRLEVS